MSIKKEFFGTLDDGSAVFSYTLENSGGMSVKILNYGGIIRELKASDKNGAFCDVVGGFDTLDSYVHADGYLGALIGRVANRIAGGKFSLDGVEYTLAQNNGENHLHGGLSGFDSKIWSVEENIRENALTLKYFSPDGEEGYPGGLSIAVKYILREDNALVIGYSATTDKKTIVNLTNHSYFNLAGYGDILGHTLWVDADRYLPTDEGLIPTGEMADVTSTPFDFREIKAIGRDIGKPHRDLLLAGGYDHCFVFSGNDQRALKKRAELYHRESGRTLEVYTDQSAIQIYTANFLNDEGYPLKSGIPQKAQSFVCLETEAMPDSINQKNFTDITLSPGEKYSTVTVYKFSVK